MGLAVPVWENFLTEEQIWQVILYLYHATPHQPRAWGRVRAVDIKREEHVEGMERPLRMGWRVIQRALIGVVVSVWLVDGSAGTE